MPPCRQFQKVPGSRTAARCFFLPVSPALQSIRLNLIQRFALPDAFQCSSQEPALLCRSGIRPISGIFPQRQVCRNVSVFPSLEFPASAGIIESSLCRLLRIRVRGRRSRIQRPFWFYRGRALLRISSLLSEQQHGQPDLTDRYPGLTYI